MIQMTERERTLLKQGIVWCFQIFLNDEGLHIVPYIANRDSKNSQTQDKKELA